MEDLVVLNAASLAGHELAMSCHSAFCAYRLHGYIPSFPQVLRGIWKRRTIGLISSQANYAPLKQDEDVHKTGRSRVLQHRIYLPLKEIESNSPSTDDFNELGNGNVKEEIGNSDLSSGGQLKLKRGDHYSSDSGHSSETDIDSLVEEYKEKVMVMSGHTIPRPVTAASARIAFLAILLLLASSLCLSTILSPSSPRLGPACLTVLLTSSLVLLVLPRNKGFPLWNAVKMVVTMSSSAGYLVLLYNPPVFLIVILWIVAGCILESLSKKKPTVATRVAKIDLGIPLQSLPQPTYDTNLIPVQRKYPTLA